ncbi:unnamed protein product, partial [Mesorhabditis belari]|uniref:Uncharacterized protein n=1 Tax=Mesorhabditis belari TaxID=2138241 RepID=A0AAF3EN41_9BILA
MRPSGFVFSTNALDGSMISQKRFEQSPQIPSSPVQQIPRSEQFGVKQAPLPSPVLPVAPPSILKCAQCGQGMLPDEQTDCPMQNIVDCAGTDTLCFTRQIMIGPGQNAVEKMCVNAVVLQNEYGEAAVKGGCAEAHQGKVRYCVCNTNECNRDPILKQISSKSKQSAPVQPIVSSNERMESAEIPPRFSIQRMPEAPLIPIQPINQPETPTKPASVSSASQPLNKLQPVPELPKPIKPANVIDVSKNIITSSGEVSLHCTMCSEMENTDPTADCKNPVTVDCAKSNGDTDQNYCITKQTQLATGLYTLEKKCTSKEEFQTEFPEEKMESGCGSAFDGLVNFCICTGEICNKKTLFEQTQIYKEILDASDGKGLEESNDENEEDNLGNGNNLPRQEFGGFVQKGPVPDSIDIRSELDQLKEKERQSVDITGLPSDDLDARQREWAAKEAELAKSQSTVTLSLLILLFCALRLL